jgi:hypothetical protein
MIDARSKSLEFIKDRVIPLLIAIR